MLRKMKPPSKHRGDEWFVMRNAKRDVGNVTRCLAVLAHTLE